MAPRDDSSTLNAPYWTRCRRTRRRAVGKKEEGNVNGEREKEVKPPYHCLFFCLCPFSHPFPLLFFPPSVSASLVVTDASSSLFGLVFFFFYVLFLVFGSGHCCCPGEFLRRTPRPPHAALHAPSSQQSCRPTPPPPFTCLIAHTH